MKLLILLLLLIPTTSQALTPEDDYTARCAAVGVVTCIGFDNTSADIVQGVNLFPDGQGTYRGGLDTAIKTSGDGSLRFSLPPPTHAGQNIGGQWSGGWGASYGQNSSYYVQIRMRVSEGMLYSPWDTNSGWKFMMFSRTGAVCGNLSIVWKIYNNDINGVNAFPIGYVECGERGLYGPGLLLQQKGSDEGYDCPYSARNPTNCFYFKPNEWMTFYFHVQLGTFGDPNSTIEAWVAREGETSWKKWIHLVNFVINSDGTGAAGAFDTLVLTPYMTALSQTSGTAGKWNYIWYDEFILSTQPIAIPNSDRVATNLPLTLGWHQLSNTKIWGGTPNLCACQTGFPTVCGASNCNGMYAYSGGIFDTNRTAFLTWGGGHNDYYGNEIYKTDLTASPPVSSRNDPTVPVSPFTCEDSTTDCVWDGSTYGSMITNGNGTTPNSRHTGDNIEFDIANDALIGIGGSLSSAQGYSGLAEAGGDMWRFDFSTGFWTRLTLDGTGDNPFNYFSGSEVYAHQPSDFTGYDNSTDCLYYHNRYRLYSAKVTGSSIKFDQITATTTSLQHNIRQVGSVDPIAKRFYILGNNQFGYYDISGVASDCSYSGAAQAFNALSLTGGPAVDPTMSKGGLEYYAPLKKMLSWVGGDIRYYDVEKDQWQRLAVGVNVVSPPSTHGPDTGLWTNGRFRCDEDIGGCVLAHATYSDLYYIRLSAYGNPAVIVPPDPPMITFQSLTGGASLSGGTLFQQ